MAHIETDCPKLGTIFGEYCIDMGLPNRIIFQFSNEKLALAFMNIPSIYTAFMPEITKYNS